MRIFWLVILAGLFVSANAQSVGNFTSLNISAEAANGTTAQNTTASRANLSANPDSAAQNITQNSADQSGNLSAQSDENSANMTDNDTDSIANAAENIADNITDSNESVSSEINATADLNADIPAQSAADTANESAQTNDTAPNENRADTAANTANSNAPAPAPKTIDSRELLGKMWYCASEINALSFRALATSQDTYYANGAFESRGGLRIRVEGLYTQEMLFDTPSIGNWKIEGDKLHISTKNTQDEINIVELSADTFITRGDNASLRICKAEAIEDISVKDRAAWKNFDADILSADSWYCTVNETIYGENTYMTMESVNTYSKNGISRVSGTMRLKFSPEEPESVYSVIYSEKWAFDKGRFKTEITDVNITNITPNQNMSSETSLKEMVSLENIFKKGTADEMEIAEFSAQRFVLQDLANLGEDGKSRYICDRVIRVQKPQ